MPLPHPQDAYRSITDKFEDSGGAWRVLLVQGLHGRADVVLLARLRAGHTPLLKAYASSAPPQTPWGFFAERSRGRSNTGYGGAPGSMQLGRPYLEVLLHPSRSLPPTLKGCWRSQGSPSGRPLALKPQQQQQQQPLQPRNGKCSQKGISRFL